MIAGLEPIPDYAGWWNDFYREIEYVQHPDGRWFAKNCRWWP